MDNLKSLMDIFNVRIDESISNLDAAQKLKFCDDALNKPSDKKGIIITFELSAAGRRINNRIYTSRGQRAGLDSWVKPYGKPILLHHDKKTDPIGRVISIEAVDNDQNAMKFFRNIRDFAEFKGAMDSDNPKAIYKSMIKNNLLTNKEWPGISKLVAKARISDREAIEKFLDQRYLTFSAGTHSDRYVCGVCEADWATGDVCSHLPGTITDKGEPVVFITGTFYGDEASVVNEPANTNSVVHAIEFTDAIPDGMADSLVIDESCVYSVDSTLEAEQVTDHRLMLYRAIEQNDYQPIVDALEGNTFTEQRIIVSIHDSLHQHWDWDLKETDSTEKVPRDVFSLHAKLHEMAGVHGYRDSFINGELDNYSSSGTETGEFKYSGGTDEQTEEQHTDEGTTEDTNQASSTTEESADTSDASNTVEVSEDDELLKDESIDWYLLDAALTVELGDATLSSEKREKLSSKSFCGPERSFPVPDCAHVTAARRLIGRAKLSADQKTRVLACVSRKAKSLNCDSADAEHLPCNCDTVQRDYESALQIIQDLKQEVENLKNSLAALDTTEDTSHNEDNQESSEQALPERVENPSISGKTGTEGAGAKLGDFEKGIVNRYLDIKSKSGPSAAELYLARKRAARHIPPSFKINQYIQENE